MVTEKDICAVVVSYNCDKKIIENIKELKKQDIGNIVIIDNGSSKESLDILQQFKSTAIIIYNDDNYGIAKALNQGICKAEELGATLLLTMDQDTVLLTDAVKSMLKVMNDHPDIVSVGPIYTKEFCKNEYLYKDVLITSGNLTYLDIVHKVNGFDEKLFIDSVDFDFSLKVRDYGKLAQVTTAKMNHKIGEYEEGRCLFFRKALLSHSGIRHYYMYRNGIYIIKKHFMRHPIFAMKKTFFSFKYLVEVLLYHYNKKEKLSMIFAGIKDGIKYNGVGKK